MVELQKDLELIFENIKEIKKEKNERLVELWLHFRINHTHTELAYTSRYLSIMKTYNIESCSEGIISLEFFKHTKKVSKEVVNSFFGELKNKTLKELKLESHSTSCAWWLSDCSQEHFEIKQKIARGMFERKDSARVRKTEFANGCMVRLNAGTENDKCD